MSAEHLTRLKLSQKGLFTPAAPDRLAIVLHQSGMPTLTIHSSAELKPLAERTKGRIEVQLPLWLGSADSEPSRIGNEPHPEGYAENVVKIANLLRPYITETGTLWLWLPESSVDLGVYGHPPAEVIAFARHDGRPRTEWNKSFSPDFDLLGVLGELAFAREFGGRLFAPGEKASFGSQDPGYDFRTRAGTVNVKCSPTGSRWLLLQKSHRQIADIQVMSIADEEMRFARLVGWEYTSAIVGGETVTIKDPSWGIKIDQLRPIATLREMAEIPWRPGEPVGIIPRVLESMLRAKWELWGTGFVDPRPVQIGVPRVYVFSGK